jgi:hypothetical protein
MTAYIIFNVYDYSEFYLWDIATSKSDAVKEYTEKHLVSFLQGAQPDISILELRKVQMTAKTFHFLSDALKEKERNKETTKEIQKILKLLYDGNEEKYIYSFQGDDILEIADFYAKQNNYTLTEDGYYDEINEILQKLCEDEEEFKRTIKSFIEIM